MEMFAESLIRYLENSIHVELGIYLHVWWECTNQVPDYE